MTERFTLLSELGRGGMGVVWKARDEETGSIVALKLLREAYSEDPEYLARFERELELAKRIYSRNVVEVLGFGVRGKVPYLALEYVEGPSLHEALVAHGPYSWTETKAILTQLTQGLADAHAAGVIHRDVKPSNVLIGPDGVAKLTDFGIARGLDLTRVTATSTLLGTPAYLAPEGPKDGRSDLYSLGVIGYELLTGAVPFKGTTYQEVIVEHVRTPPDLTKLPAEARPIIGWLLAKDPSARPQRASDLLPVLYGAAQVPLAQVVGPNVGSPPALPPQRPRGFAARRTAVVLTPGRAIAATALIALIVVLAAFRVVGSSGGSSASSGSPTSSTPGGSASGVAMSSSTPTPTPNVTSSSTPSPTHPASSGPWAPAESLPYTFWGAGSVELSDGRVLLVGGVSKESSATALVHAEIYDPATGHWSAATDMLQARAYPMVVRLKDDSILVVGGALDGQPLATAERYVPRSGGWLQAGSMRTSRTQGTLTLLSDGRVLVAGGGDVGAPTYAAIATAEIYDPTTNAWTDAAPMSMPRTLHTATMLPDGEVLVAGGATAYTGSQGTVTASAEIYDPRANAWHAAAPMSVPRYVHSVTALADGRVLEVGGWSDMSDNNPSLATAEIYDPTANSWTPTGSMAAGRARFGLVGLGDGRLLAAAGVGPSYQMLATAELWDPATGRWQTTGFLPAAVMWPAIAVLPNGRVLIAGGALDTSAAQTTNLCALYSYAP